MPAMILNAESGLHLLSALTLSPSSASMAPFLASVEAEQLAPVATLAQSNHVVIRAFERLQAVAHGEELDAVSAWARQQLDRERLRITQAVSLLHMLCQRLQEGGCPVVVIKTLDHWPDFGNDLDLYTPHDIAIVKRILVGEFGARICRSWGDRLAGKTSFLLPGCDTPVEVHVGRMGQTGEHVGLGRRIVERQTTALIGGHRFPVPAPEEQVLLATLQRMYRHLFFRISDFINTGALLAKNALDFRELRRAADAACIGEGVQAYLRIVLDYIEHYSGQRLVLPDDWAAPATSTGERLFLRGRFFRIPAVPDGARLYLRELATTLSRGNLAAAFRLALLVPLAATAVASFKLTGSNQGIW